MEYIKISFFALLSFIIHGVAFSSNYVPVVGDSEVAIDKQSISIKFTSVKALKKSENKVDNKHKSTLQSDPKRSVESKSVAKPMQQKKAVVKSVVESKQVAKRVVKPSPQKLVSVANKLVENDTKIKSVESVINKIEPHNSHTELSHSLIHEHENVVTTMPKMVKQAKFTSRPTPIHYPHSAKRRNIEGLVLIEVWLDAQGKQIKQVIINSSGHQILDNAAITAITNWQFSSHQYDGQSIAYRVQVPINFELN